VSLYFSILKPMHTPIVLLIQVRAWATSKARKPLFKCALDALKPQKNLAERPSWRIKARESAAAGCWTV